MDSLDFIFILRIISATALLMFLGWTTKVSWKSYQNTVAITKTRQLIYGQLEELLEETEGNYIPTGKNYSLLALTNIGRSPTNHIVVNNNFASQEHASIRFINDQWWLEDRNSRNGTQLNNEVIEEAIVVADGDIISIGQLSYRIHLNQTHSTDEVKNG
ncbi:hypothetical protein MASR2M15_19340 [Anaerolineales bacterium]